MIRLLCDAHSARPDELHKQIRLAHYSSIFSTAASRIIEKYHWVRVSRLFLTLSIIVNHIMVNNTGPFVHNGKTHLPIPKGILITNELISFYSITWWIIIQYKGRYVVGCTDVMVGPSVEDGSFFRLFYPTDIATDKIYVHGASNYVILYILKIGIFQDHCEQWPKWLAHPKYIEGFTEVDWLKNLPFIGQKIVGWAFGIGDIL